MGQTEPHQTESRFTGGAVGYFSYDSIRYWENLPENTVDDQGFPDVEVGLFDDGIVFDRPVGLFRQHLLHFTG